MTPIHIEGQTTGNLRPPGDWDPTKSGECQDLPFQPIVTSGIHGMASFWKPSPEEWADLEDGGAVQLVVLGTQHPVVQVTTASILMHGDLRPPPTNDGPEQLRAQRDVLLHAITDFLQRLDDPRTEPGLDDIKQLRHVRSVCAQGGVDVTTTDKAMVDYLRSNGVASVGALKELLE